MAKKNHPYQNPEDLSAEQLMYPDAPAFIDRVAITRQALKAGELKCEIQAVTNVPNLAALTPEAWTAALFGFLLDLHRGDYEHFRASCTDAVIQIKDEINRRAEAAH